MSPHDDIDVHLRLLMDPFGDEPHRRQREASVRYLLVHADEAYPRLVQALKSNPAALNSPSIIEVLPRFGRADSVPLLEDIMNRGVEQVSGIAGQALGRHPDASAKEALLRALASPSPVVLAAAADGLMVRGDTSVCSDLEAFLRNENAVVRYHAVQASIKLGCLNADLLNELKRTYPELSALVKGG